VFGVRVRVSLFQDGPTGAQPGAAEAGHQTHHHQQNWANPTYKLRINTTAARFKKFNVQQRKKIYKVKSKIGLFVLLKITTNESPQKELNQYHKNKKSISEKKTL